MFGTSLTLVAAAAVVLTAGAIQFGSTSNSAALSEVATSRTTDHVNRAAKTDRSHVVRKMASRTYAIQPVNLPETSILFHIPAATGPQARDVSSPGAAPVMLKSPAEAARALVACEPTVSVLTEVAKQLAPGRCLT